MGYHEFAHDYSPRLDPDKSLDDCERCRHDFRRPYLGGETLPKQLEEYIASCVQEWAKEPTRFKFPCISIVQTPGFGKSRLLRELAHRTKDDPTGSTKVLYTCVRPAGMSSSGYPIATHWLRDYFFPCIPGGRVCGPSKLVDKLFRLYDFAMTHWDSIGCDWFPLFDGQRDAAIGHQLDSYTAQEMTATEAGTPLEAPRILVLAIDEARFLFRMSDSDRLGWS